MTMTSRPGAGSPLTKSASAQVSESQSQSQRQKRPGQSKQFAKLLRDKRLTQRWSERCRSRCADKLRRKENQKQKHRFEAAVSGALIPWLEPRIFSLALPGS